MDWLFRWFVESIELCLQASGIGTTPSSYEEGESFHSFIKTVLKKKKKRSFRNLSIIKISNLSTFVATSSSLITTYISHKLTVAEKSINYNEHLIEYRK